MKQFRKEVENSTLLNLITPMGLTFHARSVVIGETKGKISGAWKFPNRLKYGWAADIMKERNAITTITYYPDPSLLEGVSQSVKKYRDKAASTSDTLEANRADRAVECAKKLVDQLDKENESIGYVSILTLPLAPEMDDAEGVRSTDESVKRAYSRNAIKLRGLPNEQEAAFKAMSPYYATQPTVDEITKRIFPLSTVVGGFPFAASGFVDENGFYWGKNADRGMMALDGWRRGGDRTNSCYTVLGKSGTGKSTFIKNLIITEFMRGTKIIIIDPEGEYTYITKRLDGSVLYTAGGKNSRSNPLEIRAVPKSDDEDEQADDSVGSLAIHLKTLEVFFRLYIPSLTDIQNALLKQVLIELYARAGILWDTDSTKLKSEDYPIMTNLYELLCEKAGEESGYRDEYDRLSLLLTDIAKGSDAFLWNGHTTLKADSNVVCLNTGPLQDVSPNIKGAQYYNLTTWCWNEMTKDKRPVLLICDEAHLMIDKRVPEALTFLKSGVKRCRKFVSGLVIASHSAVDFLADEIKAYGQALLDQPCYKVLFGTDGKNLAEMAELFHLTDREVELLERQEIGVGITVIGKNKMKTYFDLPDYKFEFMGIKKSVGGDVGKKAG